MWQRNSEFLVGMREYNKVPQKCRPTVCEQLLLDASWSTYIFCSFSFTRDDYKRDLDHPNFTQCLSVHVKDLMNFDQSDSDIAQKFRRGFFVARKTAGPFSAIAFDQSHEQVNATLKGDGDKVYIQILNFWKIINF